MLRPSYTDLMEILNKGKGEVITSRYTLVIAAAKRARMLIDKHDPLTQNTRTDKPVSIAVQELYDGFITIHQ